MSIPNTTAPAVDLPRLVRPGVSGDLGSVAEYHSFTTGSRVYARRVALGMTQEELGRRTGLKPTAISHFESGRRKPCLKNLLLLCGSLECSPNDLLLGANHRSAGSADSEKLEPRTGGACLTPPVRLDDYWPCNCPAKPGYAFRSHALTRKTCPDCKARLSRTQARVAIYGLQPNRQSAGSAATQ